MTPVNITDWNSAETLTTPERVAAYLEAVMEENDPELVAHAMEVVARAEGAALLSPEAKLMSERLQKTLAKQESPEFATVLKLFNAFGLHLHASASLD